ncbi:MAG: DUF4381 family protein [Oligoflexia bacterium]|nr:DUF4381 family protein [Oligoflexia bacterium]
MEADKIYDITDIPYFAWGPDTIAWGALALAALVILIVRMFVSRRRVPSGSSLESLRLELAKLENRAATAPHTALVSQIALLLRRYLSLQASQDLTTATPAELERLARATPSEARSQILTFIAEQERTLYSPAAATDPIAVIRRAKSLVDQLPQELQGS